MAWVIETKKEVFAEGRSKAEVKAYIMRERRKGYAYYHWVGNDLYSSKTPGCLLAECCVVQLQQYVGAHQSYAIFIRHESDVFCVAVRDKVIIKSGLVKDDAVSEKQLKAFIQLMNFVVIGDAVYQEVIDKYSLRSLPHVELPASVNIRPSAESDLVRGELILNQHARKIKFAIAFLLLSSVVGYGYYDWYQTKLEEEAARQQEVKDPYKAVRELLTISKTNVKIFMAQFSSDMEAMKSIPGYEVTRVTSAGSNINFELIQKNGRSAELEKWAKANGYTLSFANNKMQMTKTYVRMAIISEPVLPPIDGLTVYVMDAVKAWWDTATVNSEVSVSDKWVERKINIDVTNWTSFDFDSLGSLLNGQTIGIESLDLTQNTDGFNGRIQFIAYGRPR